MKISMNRVLVLTFGLAILCSAATLRAEDKTPAIFRQKCAACHGPDGKAQTAAAKNLGVKSFADPAVAKMSETDLSAAIEKGKGKMPAYGKSMTADDIKAMVAYIRALGK